MSSELSKYASNQFEVATVGRFPLMSEILADTRPRLVTARASHPEFEPPLNLLDEAIAHWDAGETLLANAEARVPSCTLSFMDKLDSLTRKPDADTNSPLENWDVTIRGQVAYQGPTYLLLLPHGRETLTVGTYDARLDAGRDFGVRLAAQTAKPVLVALGATVTGFFNSVRALRGTQATAKRVLDDARVHQEALRLEAAEALLNMVGVGLQVFRGNVVLVDTLFDVNLLRGGAVSLPEAPTDTFWTPAQRKLSTSAMPAGATRLEAWREGPGGMPERLVVGTTGVLELVVPAAITFTAGELYQLWLVAVNSRGSSAPGPKQNWTAG